MMKTDLFVLLQWFEEKLQEVEAADLHFRKLHVLVESLVVHRKGEMSPTMKRHSVLITTTSCPT